jgi:phosphoribosylglycinamide formyltransferase 1
VLGDEMLGAFPGRIVNIHPALLPAFAGVRAQRQAFEAGVKVTGCTVHFVESGVDTGPIIAQAAYELTGAVDAAALREALRPLEHDLLCEAVLAIGRGLVRIDPDHPRRVLVDA